MTPTCNEITREMHSQFVEGTVDEGAECGGRVKCDKSGFKRGAGREKKLGKLRNDRYIPTFTKILNILPFI
jgi:hypothetical protein